ncbi:MAG TPA: hypothetical protein VFH73_27750 [Polyangia bacterium]|nr:hypothetical protein [Polyangia bacterium]
MVLLSGCGGGDGGGGGGGGSPITERPSRAAYTCSVARGVTEYAPRTWQSSPALVVSSGGAAYLLRIESMPTAPFMPVPGQMVSGSLAADGTLGATTAVPSVAAQTVAFAAAVPRGDGFVAVWGESGKLRFAAFDAAGSAQVPKDVITGTDAVGPLQIAAGPDGGLGVIYTASADTNNHELHFVVVGPDGDVRGGPRRLDQTSGNVGYGVWPAPAIAGGPSGYAMIWRNLVGTQGGIEFAKAGADGTETVARRRISTGAGSTIVGGSIGFESPVNALLETSGGYLAAWVETQSSSSTVVLARLDASGVRLGPPAPLRAAAGGFEEVEPSLVRYGDAVAVLWARAKHIVVCGGCIPDNHIDLLLIDPTDLTPVSNVVSLVNDRPNAGGSGLPSGGLLRRQAVNLGQSLLTTFDIQFHTHHTSASAAFSCQK